MSFLLPLYRLLTLRYHQPPSSDQSSSKRHPLTDRHQKASHLQQDTLSFVKVFIVATDTRQALQVLGSYSQLLSLLVHYVQNEVCNDCENLTPFMDHKLCGIDYILAEFYTLYSIFFRADAFYNNHFELLMTYVLGDCTCCAALRNFGHLSKTDDNAGMFVDNRTFSYPFLVENLWFQVITLLNQAAYT